MIRSIRIRTLYTLIKSINYCDWRRQQLIFANLILTNKKSAILMCNAFRLYVNWVWRFDSRSELHEPFLKVEKTGHIKFVRMFGFYQLKSVLAKKSSVYFRKNWRNALALFEIEAPIITPIMFFAVVAIFITINHFSFNNQLIWLVTKKQQQQ